eukprot:PLAT1362.1.p1 GENE.PLAT1362.1~~PLAT1362.1.p1  ORF type:complete len:354 (+),score=135.65 PLAT1362.1:47-1108(+)
MGGIVVKVDHKEIEAELFRMKLAAMNAELQTDVCELLTRRLRAGGRSATAYAAAVGAAGGVELVAAALNTHAGDEVVVRNAIQALAALTAEPENCERMRLASVQRLALAARERFAEDEFIPADVARLLGRMSEHGEARAMAALEAAERIADAASTVAQLEAHPFTKTVQLRGLKMLLAMWQAAERSQTLMAEDVRGVEGLRVLLATVSHHMEDEDVLCRALALLTALAKDWDNRVQLVVLGVVTRMVEVLRRQYRSLGIVQWVIWTLSAVVTDNRKAVKPLYKNRVEAELVRVQELNPGMQDSEVVVPYALKLALREAATFGRKLEDKLARMDRGPTTGKTLAVLSTTPGGAV